MHLHLRQLVLFALGWMAGFATAADNPSAPSTASLPPAPPVAVRHGTITFDWTRYRMRHETGRGGSAANFADRKATPLEQGPKTLPVIVLENEYLSLQVCPDAGGPVARVVVRASGSDMFHWSGTANNDVVSWTSGVKGSFPYKEHGIRAVEQPASSRVIRHPDGAVTVVLWMEFSRWDGPWNARMFGRYGNMLFSQHVTLRPQESLFRVTYRVVNPTPYRQGRQLWNVATWPRHQSRPRLAGDPGNPQGRTTTEWIFPAAHVSGHSGERFRPYETADTPLAELGGSSVFGWAMQHGFAGLWYPEVRVNRLRITDPAVAPGSKQFYNAEPDPGNSVELWTGSDSIFEQVEGWIEPGESFQYTLGYAMTEGIGKVDFANDRAAVNIELDSPSPKVEVVTFVPVKDLTCSLEGQPVGGPVDCTPNKPARFDLPKGLKTARIKLTGNGRALVDEHFPLVIKADEKRYEVIRQTLTANETWEKLGDSESLGRAYQRAPYPDGTTARGRVLYRTGAIGAAIATLRNATVADANDGEAWHLLGAAQMENGQLPDAMECFGKALRAARAYPPARYFLAMENLRAGNPAAARRQLESLLVERPNHFEARLLLAGLGAGNLNDARKLVDEDPGDPRALYVLWKVCEKSGQTEQAQTAKTALEAMLAEPGAQQRLDDFTSATTGHYRHPNRMKSPGQWNREHPEAKPSQ